MFAIYCVWGLLWSSEKQPKMRFPTDWCIWKLSIKILNHFGITYYTQGCWWKIWKMIITSRSTERSASSGFPICPCVIQYQNRENWISRLKTMVNYLSSILLMMGGSSDIPFMESEEDFIESDIMYITLIFLTILISRSIQLISSQYWWSVLC